MKSYAIHDYGLDRKAPVGYLFYYNRSNSFMIELCDDLSEWDAPLLFMGLIKKGIRTVPPDIAYLWVKERLVPSSRQNIGSILKNEKLKNYNEMTFLLRNNGECCQDDCYIKEISDDEIPDAIKSRFRQTVTECFPVSDKNIICIFRDNTVRKTDLKSLSDSNKYISHVIQNEKLFYSVRTGIGGYSIVFNDSIEIPARELIAKGTLLPLSADDFFCFVKRNIVDTSEATNMLGCSRQNLSYFVKNNMLTPIKSGGRETLFTRGEITRMMNG